jgi:imidazolonepropionase-like amidohydrolase
MAAEIMHETGNLGVIAPGAHADIIVVNQNPLEDVRVLADSGNHLSVIMKAGKIYKNVI